MIKNIITKYLAKHGVDFEVLEHKTIYTAYDLSQTLKADLKQIAKTLLVKADSAYVLVVVPAYYRIDLAKLKKALKAKKVSIPNEKVIIKILKVKTGGMTSFGSLHQVETWVDKSLLKTQRAIFNAGSFTESLRLKVKDFVRMENAKLGNFVVAAKYPKPVKTKPKPKAKNKKKVTKKKPVKKVKAPAKKKK
ncbi:MAG: YbaK/EbsC family protein [Patescibacteria group bacterium]